MRFFFFLSVVLLYGNELSDGMKMLCCGNVLQNTHIQINKPNQTNGGAAFFCTSRLLMNLFLSFFFFNPPSARYVHSVL